ncbi:MAG: signal peptide peptidase SppA, partial [Woeseiaceae bacterium]|nr:signal peptide peptidase SppA [Woeseiaceae bacterium]
DEHNWTDMRSFLAEIRTMNGVDVRSQNIGVIVAAGDITFGSPPPGTIGSESTSLLLRRALHDDSVKAIVLRIDSPGGSAFASDVIANEIDAIKAAGKPVVASMSSVAASGGYWIAAGADRILASPSTITGSIGIFGMLPTYQRTLEALGVNVDGVGTTIWAGELRPDREMGAHAKQLFQTIIEDGYRDFLTRVSVTRGLDIDALDAIAQGRVWTGVDALDRGLVDELGNLNDAVTIAAELSGLAEGSYGTRFIEEGLSPTEQLIVELLESLQQLGMDPRSFSRRPSQLEKVAGKLEQMLTPMLNFNDPRGVYAHCLCSFE